jgi:hypothetical protein
MLSARLSTRHWPKKRNKSGKKMILYNVEPANNEPAYSLGLIAKKLKVSNSAIHSVVRNSMRYTAFGNRGDGPNANAQHLFIPIKSAQRLIKDADAGRILKRAKRIE